MPPFANLNAHLNRRSQVTVDDAHRRPRAEAETGRPFVLCLGRHSTGQNDKSSHRPPKAKCPAHPAFKFPEKSPFRQISRPSRPKILVFRPEKIGQVVCARGCSRDRARQSFPPVVANGFAELARGVGPSFDRRGTRASRNSLGAAAANRRLMWVALWVGARRQAGNTRNAHANKAFIHSVGRTLSPTHTLALIPRRRLRCPP